jgi:hypothetical protein
LLPTLFSFVITCFCVFNFLNLLLVIPTIRPASVFRTDQSNYACHSLPLLKTRVLPSVSGRWIWPQKDWSGTKNVLMKVEIVCDNFGHHSDGWYKSTWYGTWNLVVLSPFSIRLGFARFSRFSG